jgi:hypothetical protein
VNYDTLGIQPTGIASGDFNSDLSPDLAVTDVSSADVTILLNNGRGGFKASAAYSVGTSPFAITVYAGENLVVAGAAVGKISLLHGNSDGTFTDIRNFPVGVFPFALTQGFLNGDSTPDIAVADQNNDAVYVLRSTGTAFSPARLPTAGNVFRLLFPGGHRGLRLQ